MRIRTVKPEFWTNEKMSELHPETCLLSLALLNYADDEGFFNANPKLIKAALFPLRELSVSITVGLRELYDIGYIAYYLGSDNRVYGHVVKFSSHQKVNNKSKSKIKELVDLSEPYGSPTLNLPLGTGNREQVSGNREQGTNMSISEEMNAPQFKDGDQLTLQNVSRETSEPKKPRPKKWESEMMEVWEFYKEHCKTRNEELGTVHITEPRVFNDKYRKTVKARLNEGYTVEQLKDAVRGCLLTPHNLGENDNNKPYTNLDLICRDGSQVERFIGNAKEQAPKQRYKNVHQVIADNDDPKWKAGEQSW